MKFLWQRLKQLPLRQPVAWLETSVYLTVAILWLMFSSPNSPTRLLFGNLLVAIPAFTALVQITFSLPSLSKENRQAWFFLGLAVGGWALRHFSWILYGLIRQSDPPPFSLADIFGLLAYPFATLGLLRFSRGFRHAPTRFRFLLDVIINSGVIVTFGWLFLQPIATEAIWLRPERLIPILYPIANLILLMVAVNVVLSGSMPRFTAVILGIALLSLLFSDYAYAFLSLSENYHTGTGISLGWVIAYLLLGNEALRQRRDARVYFSRWQRPWVNLSARIQNVLPITLVLALDWYVLTRWQLQGQFSLVGLLMSLLLSVIVIVRIGIRAGEAELQQYWQLFSNLADPAFICNADGKIVLSNPALDALLHQPGEELWHVQSLSDLFVANGTSLTWRQAAQQSVTLEVTLKQDNRPFLLTLSPILSEGRPMIAGVAHDLSVQKEQENTVRQAYTELQALHRRLEEVNATLEAKVEERTRTLMDAYRQLEEQHRALQELDRLKDDFISMVSHELRTPLNNLGGGLELLLSRNSVDGDSRSTLQLMQAEVHRLTRFVENILDLSALEAGRLQVHIVPLSLAIILEEMLRRREQSPGFERLQIKMPPDLPFVLADASALESVLHHLLDNALKYAPHGPVVIEAFVEKKKVRVQVSDAGPGIPPQKQRFLFQKFQRLNAHDAQTVYGYGLGLYLSRRLLKAMHSDLSYETSAQGGACFYFTLKVAK